MGALAQRECHAGCRVSIELPTPSLDSEFSKRKKSAKLWQKSHSLERIKPVEVASYRAERLSATPTATAISTPAIAV
jgi:hypothetical protein